MGRKKSREDEIRAYASTYHSPIGDFKGFNELLQQNTGKRTTKKKVFSVLGY